MKHLMTRAEVGGLLGQKRLSRQEAFRREQLPWELDDEPDLRRADAVAPHRAESRESPDQLRLGYEPIHAQEGSSVHLGLDSRVRQ